MDDRARYGLPSWLLKSWWLVFPGTGLLVGRMLYEKSYLTWSQGPQMIGFSLAHIHPLSFLLGFLSVCAAHVWLVVAAVAMTRGRFRLPPSHWTLVGLTVVTLALDYLPTTACQRILIAMLGQGA